MSISVLRAGFDTIDVSFYGTIHEDVASTLDGLKELAQATETPQPYPAGLHDMLVMASAYRLWRWRLVHPCFSVVARPKAAAGSAIAQVKFSAFGLANHTAEELWMLVQIAVETLGPLRELSVSRADIAADFQGWVPTPSDMAGMVCPAAYRATHGSESGVETYYFGKKKLVRVYDKTTELLKSKKVWLPDLWRRNETYDASLPVWRVEFQADRETLKTLGIDTVAQLLASPDALLDHGLTWANLRVPTDDATKKRWPEHPAWTQLREAVFCGEALHRRVTPSAVMTLDAAKVRLRGLAALAGVYFETDDYLSALQQLSFANEVEMMQEGIDFAALVEQKRRRVMSGQV